jgi:hypothetical protein
MKLRKDLMPKKKTAAKKEPKKKKTISFKIEDIASECTERDIEEDKDLVVLPTAGVVLSNGVACCTAPSDKKYYIAIDRIIEKIIENY